MVSLYLDEACREPGFFLEFTQGQTLRAFIRSSCTIERAAESADSDFDRFGCVTWRHCT